MPFAEVNSTTLQFRFDGPEQGPVVMLSNALASDLTMWEFQVPALTEAGYRVLRYDSRGLGHSKVSEGPYSIEMLTTDAVGLMDALGLEKVHFCGLSMGGMIGQMLGVQYGDVRNDGRYQHDLGGFGPALEGVVDHHQFFGRQAFIRQAQRFDTRTVQEDVTKADLNGPPFRLTTSAGEEIEALGEASMEEAEGAPGAGDGNGLVRVYGQWRSRE